MHPWNKSWAYVDCKSVGVIGGNLGTGAVNLAREILLPIP